MRIFGSKIPNTERWGIGLYVWDAVENQKYKARPKVAAELRHKSGKQTEKEVKEILDGACLTQIPC